MAGKQSWHLSQDQGSLFFFLFSPFVYQFLFLSWGNGSPALRVRCFWLRSAPCPLSDFRSPEQCAECWHFGRQCYEREFFVCCLFCLVFQGRQKGYVRGRLSLKRISQLTYSLSGPRTGSFWPYANIQPQSIFLWAPWKLLSGAFVYIEVKTGRHWVQELVKGGVHKNAYDSFKFMAKYMFTVKFRSEGSVSQTLGHGPFGKSNDFIGVTQDHRKAQMFTLWFIIIAKITVMK